MEKATLSFDNTKIAFAHQSNGNLRFSYWLFKAININWLVKVAPTLTNMAMAIRLPISALIKGTIFKQFCGGESIQECEKTIQLLSKNQVGTILDYSIEGEQNEEVFDSTAIEIISTIHRAAKDPKAIPFSVFKVTGIARFGLLEKIQDKLALTHTEELEWERVRLRVEKICKAASDEKVRVFVDAEESWIQVTIDNLANEMMARFNQEQAIVYNTFQLYRHDRLAYFQHSYDLAVKGNYFLGAKLVRGAYMEKERKRAADKGYASPIQPDKASSDRDYDQALRFTVEHIDRIAICAGTHNEQSSLLLTELMAEKGIVKEHPHIYFSQLLGMSDNLSFNLSAAGYNVAKYVPYGPVKAVLPYLFRRANENTAIAGQMGRELGLIIKERRRRRG